jgi:hypothetical protein
LNMGIITERSIEPATVHGLRLRSQFACLPVGRVQGPKVRCNLSDQLHNPITKLASIP